MDLVTIPSSEAHVQTPKYGEYPYTSVQSHHPGSGSHGQLFCPHENSSEWHSPRREVSLAFIDPAGYYRGEYRLSQSPSLLISGSGSLPHREGLLLAVSRLRGRLGQVRCRKASWGCFGGRSFQNGGRKHESSAS